MSSRHLTILDVEQASSRRVRITYRANDVSDVVEFEFEQEPAPNSWVAMIEDDSLDFIDRYPDLARRFIRAAIEIAAGVQSAPVMVRAE